MTQMKYFPFFLFIVLAVPKYCFGQNTNVYYDDYAPIDETIIWFGPMIGINLNHYQTASFPYPGLDPAVISEQNGKGYGPMFGITGELPLDPANQKMIFFDLFYDSKSAAFNSGSAHNVNLEKIMNYPATGNINTDISASLSYFMIGAGFI